MNFMCLLSALCFIVGNAVTIAYYVVEYRRPHFNYKEYIDLDPAYIQEEWAFRDSVRPMYTSAGVINTFAWFFLMFPLVQLAWILSQGGTNFSRLVHWKFHDFCIVDGRVQSQQLDHDGRE